MYNSSRECRNVKILFIRRHLKDESAVMAIGNDIIATIYDSTHV